MSISASRIWDGFTASAATQSANGSSDLGFETKPDSQRQNQSPEDWWSNDQAVNHAHISGCGTISEPRRSSTLCAIQGPFMRRSNGGIGQEIIDADGSIVAWTTNERLAVLIVELLNKIEGT